MTETSVSSAARWDGPEIDAAPPARAKAAAAQATLTICIPTYNREHHLKKLLLQLQSEILTPDNADIEVVVVNNASADGTRAMLDGISHPSIRMVHRTQFLLTAEENVIHSLGYCTGTYVWFLGDDDVPVIRNFPDHMARLRAGRDDYLIFNTALADHEGTVFSMQTLAMNGEEVRGTTVDIAVWTGCLFVFAGISNHIVRRSLLSTERGVHYLQASRIYSMVAWMIEAGAKARTVLVNRPLVYYRENDYRTGHWERVATRMAVGDFYFWGLGLVELFTKLIESQTLTYSQVGQIFDVVRDGARYRLIDEIIVKTFQQIRCGATSRDPRQRLTPAEIGFVVDFCNRADPLAFDIMRCLVTMSEIAASTRGAAPDLSGLDAQTRTFDHLFAARQRAGQWICRVEQVYKGYEILATGGRVVAIRAGISGLREHVMRVVDPDPMPPLVFVAGSRAELLTVVADHAARATASDAIKSVPPFHVAGSCVTDLTLLKQLFPQPEPAVVAAVPDRGPELVYHRVEEPSTTELTLLRQVAAHQEQIVAMYNSNSWAISYPGRALGRLIRTFLRLGATLLGLIPAVLLRRT